MDRSRPILVRNGPISPINDRFRLGACALCSQEPHAVCSQEKHAVCSQETHAESSRQAPKATIWEKPFFEVENKKMRSAMACKTPRLSSRNLSPEVHLCKNGSQIYSKNGTRQALSLKPPDKPLSEASRQALSLEPPEKLLAWSLQRSSYSGWRAVGRAVGRVMK